MWSIRITSNFIITKLRQSAIKKRKICRKISCQLKYGIYSQNRYTVRADCFDASILGGTYETIRARYKEMEENKDITQKDKDLMIVMELVMEMLCRGIRLAPVDLEKSDATNFQLLSDNLIRMPFNALPGLGEAAAHAIVEAREQSPFISVEDLRNRGKVSQSLIDLMRECGCLKDLPETNQTTLFSF